MMFSTRCDKAKNGMVVSTTVDLDEEKRHKPWMVKVQVNHVTMYHSHHEVRSEAEKKADEMHKAYLKTHSKKTHGA